MGKDVLLGVTGSIAAYKAAELARGLVRAGHSVHVVMTRSAQEFITPLTFQTLTRNKVHTEMFERLEAPNVEHVSLAKRVDLVILAPATANLIGKLAGGIADDMLTTVCMAAWQKPMILCPAMNTAMYENPFHQANLRKLQETLECTILQPRQAELACGDVGRGALAEVSDILTAALKKLEDIHGND